jgi:hypothetical protein
LATQSLRVCKAGALAQQVRCGRREEGTVVHGAA